MFTDKLKIPTGELKMIFQVNGTEVKRKFLFASKKTVFEDSLAYLDENKAELADKEITESCPGLHLVNDILNDQAGWFGEFKEMSWYFDLIAKKIIERKGDYKITIKTCKEHRFLDVSYKSCGKRKLLLPPFFHKTPPPSNLQESMRGLADTILFLAPIFKYILKLDNNKLKAILETNQDKQTYSEGGNQEEYIKQGRRKLIADAYAWFKIDLETHRVRKLNSTDGELYELSFRATTCWSPLEVAKGKKSIIIFDSRDKEKHDITVSSKNVRTAINELSAVWHNPAASIVMLSAGTGSGKEVLKDVLAYALSVYEIKTIEFPAPQLASNHEPLRPIFEEFNNKKVPKSFDSESKEHKLKQPHLLFIDEVHHESARRLREQLLRLLEAKKLPFEKTIDCKNVRFLFAASETPAQYRSYDPPDFWTRIEYTIMMRHPLLLDSQEEITETLQQLFCVFWRKAAKKYWDETEQLRESESKFNQTLVIVKSLCPSVAEGKATDELALYKRAETESNRLIGLSRAFAKALDSPLIPVISVRMIRSIVNRLFNDSIYYIQTRDKQAAENGDIEDKMVKEIEGKMFEWIIRISKEIIPDIRSHGVF